ncbi:hypothetical protein [Paenibacillus kobensis]|uniref:hypothetical protein n=1 Tax=Paenibacillus kobensis TaxID=59841 RepID=UPI000FD93F42|nr:hypothetical protein [Paenibacillus kobensis]
MEKLIDFLLDNIYLVIVVAGFVLSAMGKRKGKGDRRTTRMPDFGGGDAASVEEGEPQRHRPSNGQPPLPGRQPSAERPQPAAVRRVPSSSGPAVAARTQPAEREDIFLSTELQDASSPRVPEQRSTRPTVVASATGKQVAAADLDVKAMRQAVVWSEILGPPRAKRPWNR